MSKLEIQYPDGRTDEVRLSRRQPLSIGSHASNDVRIEGNDVPAMHCRISYKDGEFRTVSGTPDGIDLNGTIVQKHALDDGDTLRVGDVDVTIRLSDRLKKNKTSEEKPQEESPKVEALDDLDTFSLKPLTDEIDLNKVPPAAKSEEEEQDEPPALALDDEPPALADDKEARRRERKERARAKRRKAKEAARANKSRSRSKQPDSDPAISAEIITDESDDAPADDVAGDDLDWMKDHAAGDEVQPADEAKTKSRKAKQKAAAPETETEEDDTERVQLRKHFRAKPKRPGEQDALKSPLVLGLAGGAVALTLLSLTFYFILSRQTTQAEFDEAQAQMDEGKYSQAINLFTDFIALYPRDELVDQARINLGVSQIEREISGGTPDWPEGLKQVKAFINARRDLEGFEELHDGIWKRAGRISLGSAESADKNKDRSLLETSEEAITIVNRYSPAEAPPTELLKEIDVTQRASEASILQYETFMQALADIDASLKEKQTLKAFKQRRDFLLRYPQYEKDKELRERMEAILTTEQEQTTYEEVGRDALTEPVDSPLPPPVTAAFQARSRTDLVSEGRTVVVLAKGSCYATDSVTGVPLWRQPVGVDTPFFPLAVDSSSPGFLMFNTGTNELLMLERPTGKLIWRQPLDSAATGRPLIDGGNIYIASAGGHLNHVMAESGRLVGRLNFSQPIESPPVLVQEGKRLLIAGNEEAMYTLDTRPLSCTAVTYVGHQPDSIDAPLLPMGRLVMMAENFEVDLCRLRVFRAEDVDNGVPQVAQEVIDGNVLRDPVIWGRDLFVPSTGERVAAFTVSDDLDQPPLTVGPIFQVQGSQDSPVYLSTGPDRQLWMASSALRRLQLSGDALQPDSNTVAEGRATQPAQQIGNMLYLGRTLPYSSAVVFTQTQRDDFTSEWQFLGGATPLAMLAAGPTGDVLLMANEAGDVFRMSPRTMEEPGFVTSPAARIGVPEGLETPLRATVLGGDSIAVDCGDPQPKLWMINELGQVARTLNLPAPLQAAPVQMGKGLLLPMAGRLGYTDIASRRSRVQDFELPVSDDRQPAWKQAVPVDERTALVLSSDGILRQMRLQTSPKEFLDEAGRLEFEAGVSFRMGVDGPLVAIADDVGRVTLINAPTFESRGQLNLEGPTSGDVGISGGLVFVTTNRNKLHALTAGDGLEPKWSVDIANAVLGGSPLVVESTLLVAMQDGTVHALDVETGASQRRASIGVPIAIGPHVAGDGIFVAGIDGSLHNIAPLVAP